MLEGAGPCIDRGLKSLRRHFEMVWERVSALAQRGWREGGRVTAALEHFAWVVH